MKVPLFLSILTGFAWLAQSDDSVFQYAIDCVPCADTDGSCILDVSVNLYASETGYFEIGGCEGINPTLHLTVGRTYIFEQSDFTNWYHLIGFAYEADGAHVPVDELEPGVPPGNSDCNSTLSCPAPMYFMDGVYRGTYSNNELIAPINGTEDFGLDVVEPLFFHPIADWQSYGTFRTVLTFDIEYDQDIFYFCHVHEGMSARIKLLDQDGNKLNPDDTPLLPYEYADIDAFDADCGTFNVSAWQLSEQDNCPEFFVCGDSELSTFATCVEAMDCHMMSSMTTTAAGKSALFCHQMIPHHQNAVNMAKSLLKNVNLECESIAAEEGDDVSVDCSLIPLIYEIINIQNSQIIDMRSALEDLETAEFANCDVDFSDLESTTRHRQLEEETTESVFQSGIACTPCEGTDGTCQVVMSVNFYAGRMGYYEVAGCEGVNPTLHLTVGRTYLFDQSDVSNWYHLIGFAYEADGAHTGVDELEPGIAPGSSDCNSTLSCPAPMYILDGVYQGTYSNNDVIAPINGTEDFGLDAVEPLFFHPIADWISYGTFRTALKFDIEYDQDIFYFCHLHADMSGRIKLVDADGNLLNEEDTPALPYSYDVVSEYDEACGTYALEEFQLPQEQCPSEFVCGDPTGELGEFSSCIDSMNCAMLSGMTTTYGSDTTLSSVSDHDIILFIRQMIPHHENAINMAKALLLSGETECLDLTAEEGDDVGAACILDPIVRGIVNTQNYQIQTMQGILETYEVESTSQCEVTGGTDGDGAYALSLYASMLAALIALIL
eukprot:Nitzschia sp. Nitz4//scaffold233_size31335//18543//21200//NITZ4_007952-RA/size31335-augustus-gene-0.45-mRNA-1//-1//CDS//3329543382//599//frame0